QRHAHGEERGHERDRDRPAGELAQRVGHGGPVPSHGPDREAGEKCDQPAPEPAQTASLRRGGSRGRCFIGVRQSDLDRTIRSASSATEAMISPVTMSNVAFVVTRNEYRTISTTALIEPSPNRKIASGMSTLIGLKYMTIRSTWRM